MRDAEPGPGQRQCGQASHCVQGCRGEHYAVAIASSKKSQELEKKAKINMFSDDSLMKSTGKVVWLKSSNNKKY